MADTMVASGGDIGVFLGGLVVGTLLGIVLGPLIRFWVARHEWREASREARLTDEVLDRMDSWPPRS